MKGKQNALLRLAFLDGENQLVGEEMAKEAPRFVKLAGREVKALSSPTLYPTPPELAARLVELANIENGQDVLEPSAGIGALVDAMLDLDLPRLHIMATEINHDLAEHLREKHSYNVKDIMKSYVTVTTGDFLECDKELAEDDDKTVGYDRIVMNPPFNRGQDIKHINHALKKLKTGGGRLVAICANGARQFKAFEDVLTEWIPLPPGSFKEAGTNVNTAILIIDK